MSFFNISLPIFFIFFIPLSLIIMPHIFPAQRVSSRYKSTLIVTLLFWCVISISLKMSPWEMLAGILLLVAVLIFVFMLWSVLCWGYTLSMLLCFENCESIPDIKTWEEKYTHAESLLTLTHNRVQVLVWLKLATIDKNKIQLTRWGKQFSLLVNKLIKLVGIPA